MITNKNVERNDRIRELLFATIRVIIDSGKNYQWIVEVANESLKRKCMLIDLQNTAPQISY